MTATAKSKVRPKAVLKNKPEAGDCFVDGCHRVSGECAGIPLSNRCAACRHKKNYMGVKD